MALSEFDHQLLVIRSVGDVDPTTGDPVDPTSPGSTGVILENIGRLWVEHGDKASISTSLRDAFVKRSAVDLVIAKLESLVDWTAVNNGVTIRLGQRIANRREQRKAFQAEIERLLKTIRSATAAVGQLTQLVPVPPPVYGEHSSPYYPYVDANDPSFTGSPYWPKRHKDF